MLFVIGTTSAAAVAMLVLVLVCATIGTCVERCRESYSGLRLEDEDEEEGTYYSC